MEELEALVVAAAGGDERAWQQLWCAIEPRLLRIVGQPSFLGRIGQREDDRRNIVVAVMARLRDGNFQRLRVYLTARQQNAQLRFMTWLRVVAKRVGIDYLRAHPDYVRRTGPNASAPGRWVDAGTLPPASQLHGERPPVTNRGTARELLQYAVGVIAEPHVRALEQWANGDSFAEIAATLGLASARDAEKSVRATLERLRRKYRDEAA